MRPVLTTIHPARSFRDPYVLGAIDADIAKFARLLNGEIPTFSPTIYWDDSQQLNAMVRRTSVIAVDIETTGRVKRTDCAIPTLIGFADLSCGVSFRWPWPHLIREVLGSPAITKVFCNGFWYDIPILTRVGYLVQ